jgi:hypothetical protein
MTSILLAVSPVAPLLFRGQTFREARREPLISFSDPLTTLPVAASGRDVSAAHGFQERDEKRRMMVQPPPAQTSPCCFEV